MVDLAILAPGFRGHMAVAQVLRNAQWGRDTDPRPTLRQMIEEQSWTQGGRQSPQITAAAAELAEFTLRASAGVGLGTVPGWRSTDRRFRALQAAIGIAELARFNRPAATARVGDLRGERAA